MEQEEEEEQQQVTAKENADKISKANEEAINDKEIEALVINVVQAIKDKEEISDENSSGNSKASSSAEALKIKNMNLLEALTNLKNTSIYQVAAAAVSAASLNKVFNKASFNNYLQSTIPLVNLRGVGGDPRINQSGVACIDVQGLAVSCDNRLETSVYQAIENSLYVSVCAQNVAIMKAVSEGASVWMSSSSADMTQVRSGGEVMMMEVDEDIVEDQEDLSVQNSGNLN